MKFYAKSIVIKEELLDFSYNKTDFLEKVIWRKVKDEEVRFKIPENAILKKSSVD